MSPPPQGVSAMGCGPDVFRLFDLADAFMRENRARRQAACCPEETMGRRPSPGPSVQEQLYEMYGRGELDEPTFQRLKELAARGQLRPVDLAVLRYERRQQKRTQPPLSEEEAAIRQLRARIAQLEQARTDSAQVLETLEAKVREMEDRAREREEAARQAVARDESLARRYLLEKQTLLETRARLVEQAEALRKDMERLDGLKAQLEAKVAELEALRSRETLQTLQTEALEDQTDE